MNSPTANPPVGTGQEILLSAADLQTANPPCYFANPTGKPTANCAVHYATPPNSIPAAGLDLTLDPVTATVTAPTFQQASVHLSSVSLIPANSGYNGDPNNPAVVALNGPNDSQGAKQTGINYQSSVTTPDGYEQGYTTQYGTTIHDNGGFVWVQLVNPTGRTRTLSQGTVQTRKFGLSTSPTGPYWTTGIDLGYPYSPLPAGGDPNTGIDGLGYLYFLANGNTSNSGQSFNWWGEASDQPSEPLNVSDADSVVNGTSYGAVSYHVQDDFTVYQLYQPPGIDSQYVPLQSFHWWWEANAQWTTSTDILTGQSSSSWLFVQSASPNASNNYDSLVMLPNAVAFPSWSNLAVIGGAIEFRYRNP